MLIDYYTLLDVKPGATTEDIKRAYRHKAKLYHPDTNRSPEAHIQFIQIKEAFDILCRAKNWEHHQKYHRPRYYHPRDPYFRPHYQHFYYQTHSAPRNNHYVKPDSASEISGKPERAFVIIMHLLFIGAGILILIFPIFTLLTQGFYPYYSKLDTLFAVVISMIVGIIMIYKLSLSFLGFIRKTNPKA
jgi:curved DNA-binding protein CbpA